jgi:uncharacterized protein with GYD domain
VPTYVFLMKANPMGAANLLFAAADGVKAQREAIEELGGSVQGQYVVTGSKDAVLVVDLPTEPACLAVSAAAEAGGFYVDALRVYSEEEVNQARDCFPEIGEALSASSQGQDEAGSARES